MFDQEDHYLGNYKLLSFTTGQLIFWHTESNNISSWSWNIEARSKTSTGSLHPWLEPSLHSMGMPRVLVALLPPSHPHHTQIPSTSFPFLIRTSFLISSSWSMIPVRVLWIFLTGVRVFYRDNLEQDAWDVWKDVESIDRKGREGEGGGGEKFCANRVSLEDSDRLSWFPVYFLR